MKKLFGHWLLIGALAGSVTLNVYHARVSSQAAAPPETATSLQAESARPWCSLVEAVGLTTDQKKQFASCCPPAARRCTQLGRRCETLLLELRRELNAEAPDAKRIDQLASNLGDIRTEQLKTRIGNILLVRKTLTPGQLNRLATSVKPD